MVFKTRKKFIWTKHCYGYLGLTAPGSIESGVVTDLNGAAWQLKIYSCIWAEAHFKRSTRGYLLGEALMKSFPNFLKTCMQKCFCILYSPLEPGRPPENKECSKRKLLCHWNTCIFAHYVEKNTQKVPFLYIEGPKYVSFDKKTLNLEAFVHIFITTIAISHFFAREKHLL